jgi:hypothetical protein
MQNEQANRDDQGTAQINSGDDGANNANENVEMKSESNMGSSLIDQDYIMAAD